VTRIDIGPSFDPLRPPATGASEAANYARYLIEMSLNPLVITDRQGRITDANRPTEEAMPEARILAVADVVEAMSSHRPYRASLGMQAALAEIREHAGLKYDAAVVDPCVRLVEDQGFELTS
jgi:hypothetical protein